MLNKISEVSKKVEKGLKYGHPCCDDEALIVVLLNTAVKKCFNKKQLRIYNDIIKNLRFSCEPLLSKVIVTENNKEAWETAHPECINRKQWERIAYKICHKYKIDFFVEKVKPPVCDIDISFNKVLPIDCDVNISFDEIAPTECITDILVDMISKDCDVFIDVSKKEKICDLAFDISKNVIDCDVLTVISIQQKLCDLNIQIEPSKKQCEAEHKILIEAHPTCTLTKKDYTTLISRNYNYCGISMIFDKGLEFTVDKDTECIKTSLNTYSTSEDLKCTTVVAKDKKTVKEILNDYKISNIIKTKITNAIHII
jgi:hypothetical protein